MTRCASRSSSGLGDAGRHPGPHSGRRLGYARVAHSARSSHDREATMANSERAGRPADPADLVDISALLRVYGEIVPDASDPAQRVAFGTSGHRGSAFRGAFNEPHILA